MFKIRAPLPNDFKVLEEIFNQNNQAYLLKINKLIYFLQNFIPPNFRGFPSIHILIEKNFIAGFIILMCASKANNSWEIKNLFVRDEFRNKGIGEELLRYVLSVYGSHGIEHFLAEVDSENFPALSLFHQCGFRRCAKIVFYEKEINNSDFQLSSDELYVRIQTNKDLSEIEKLELSGIPPDLRPALAKSKDFFKDKKDAIVLLDKSRNLLIGWSQIKQVSEDCYLLEPLLLPGWTHLYESFIKIIISDFIPNKSNKIKLLIKCTDYHTEFQEYLCKSGFIQREIKELLVRTIWQRIKEKKKKEAKVGVPYTAPT